MSPCEPRPAGAFFIVLGVFRLLAAAVAAYSWLSSPIYPGHWLKTHCRTCGKPLMVESGRIIYVCDDDHCGAIHPLLDLR